MAFDIQIWREHVAQRTVGWKNRWEKARSTGVSSLYAFLSAMTLWPVVEAAQKGDWAALAALGSVAAGIGGDLLADQIRSWKNETDAAKKVAEIAEGKDKIREALDAILEDFDVFSQAGADLESEDRPWFSKTLREELTRLGNLARFEATLRGVAVGRSVRKSVVVTGDNNSVTYVVQEYANAGGQISDQAALHRRIVGYLEWMLERFGTIELRGIKREGQQVVQMDLNTAYVHLEAEAFAGSTSWRSMRMNDLLGFGRRLVVTGGPGSGKTTVLQYAAWTLAGAIAYDRLDIARDRIGLDLEKEKRRQIEQLKKRIEGLTQREKEIVEDEVDQEIEKAKQTRLPLPIFIPLSAYAQHLRTLPGFADPHEATLATFVSRYLIEKQSGLDLPHDFFARLLHMGQAVILLLDGLDEVPTESERVRVREAVEDLVTGRKNIRVVVTCRTAAYRDRTALGRGFLRLRVKALTDEQIEALVRQAYVDIYSHDPTARQERAYELLRGIRDLEDGRQRRLGKEAERLVTSPLLVRMLLVVHFSERRLPEQRAELYLKATDAMLLPEYAPDQATADRIGSLVGGSREVHRELVQHLAFAMHRRGAAQGREITEGELRRLLNAGSFSSSLVNDFIALTRLRGTLLEERMGRYRFVHLAFQEYLTARYLAEVRRDVESIAAFFEEGHILDPWWREPVLLVAGYLNLTSPFTARLLLRRLAGIGPGMDRSVSPDMQLAAAETAAAACLEWQPHDIDLRQAIAERIQTAFQDSTLMNQARPILRAAAGDALAKLGDPRFREDAWLLLNEEMLGFVRIPEGSFLMGAHDDQNELWLANYYIARYPVTVAQFRAFVEDSGHGPGDQGSLQGLENHPAVHVTWYDASEYCAWLNSKLEIWQQTPEPLATLLRQGNWAVMLPTESQWEKAARGIDGRTFPWGEEPDLNRANYDDAGIGTTSAVGCFPGGASPYGVEDLSGNVWEWTRVKHSDSVHCSDDNREGRDAIRHTSHILRGGAFSLTYGTVRCAYRYRFYPGGHWNASGFRVVIAPCTSNSDPFDDTH